MNPHVPNPDSRPPERSRPASGVLHFDRKPTIVFDTVCTKHRGRWLADHAVHDLLRQVWSNADAWSVGRYMIMPDHIHYFAGFTGAGIEFNRWVQFWKSQFTRRHGVARHRWQASDWDHRLRTWQHYQEKWEYVRWNPVRQGLVDDPDDWPYQGTLFELRWDED